MSSRAKKKKEMREFKEQQRLIYKGFYDSVIQNLEKMAEDYKKNPNMFDGTQSTSGLEGENEVPKRA